jgi:hypothetical protein
VNNNLQNISLPCFLCDMRYSSGMELNYHIIMRHWDQLSHHCVRCWCEQLFTLEELQGLGYNLPDHLGPFAETHYLQSVLVRYHG